MRAPVHETAAGKDAKSMVKNWIRAAGAGSNGVLGFQPTTGTAGTSIVLPQMPRPASPKLSWLDRLDRWFWKQEQKRRDAYLAGAADLVELELRMRKLERARNGGFL